ncbi:MAG: type II secretion system F family protein, partial [Spirochaetota bacterium]
MVLRLPGASKLLKDMFRIRFSYTMALMLGGGVGIIEALKNTEAIFKNSVFKQIIGNAAVMVEKGESLSRALSSKVVFDSSILGMIRAGEMTDRVPQVLEKIGHNTEIELEEKLKSLTALVEPIIIIVLGIFVGFVVLAVMLPIFQVNQLFL